MRIAMTLLALALATTTACEKKKGTTESTTTGSAAVVTGSAGSAADMTGSAGSAADMAGSGAGSSAMGDTKMAKAAGNCPSTVLGSTTKAELKGKDVVLTITSDDKDAVIAIQTRSEQLV